MEISKERIEKLLVLLLLQSMSGKTMAEKAMQLNLAGFSNIEIAEFLQTKAPVVAQALYEKRKEKNKKKN